MSLNISTISGDQLKQWKEKSGSCIDKAKKKLFALSQDIWSCPELAFEERKSHDRLVRFFSEEEGWNVDSHYTLNTAFRATWGPAGGKESDTVVNIAFLCEYDALPEIGHACGHNLIAEVGAAAALGFKGVLESIPECPVRVKVTVLGTPAEENAQGKIEMIKAGAFEGLDVVFMAHPVQEDATYLPAIAGLRLTVKYYGKASHAAAYPWEGINALDAAVLAYNNVSALRQQLKPDWRIHGIIKHGGVKPNIIPDYTELMFYLRTPKYHYLSSITTKAEACFRSAAMATGCRVELQHGKYEVYHVLRNPTLETLYEDNRKSLGVMFTKDPEIHTPVIVSTDFGNVSHVVPGIHAYFYIGSEALNHTAEYTAAAGAEKAQLYTLQTAKALAMTALDVLCDPELLLRVKSDFAKGKLRDQHGRDSAGNGDDIEPK